MQLPGWKWITIFGVCSPLELAGHYSILQFVLELRNPTDGINLGRSFRLWYGMKDVYTDIISLYGSLHPIFTMPPITTPLTALFPLSVGSLACP